LVNITVYNSSLAVVAEIDYTYNDEGIRIKKVVEDSLGTTTYDYKLSGSSLVAEIVDNGYDDTTGQRTLDYKIMYNYDYDGTLIGFTLYSQGYMIDYIYVLNKTGDVTHIITTSGTVAVEYKYDAIGNIVEVVGNTQISEANSLRYRSYTYDRETRMYYIGVSYLVPETSTILQNRDFKYNSILKSTSNTFSYVDNIDSHTNNASIELDFSQGTNAAEENNNSSYIRSHNIVMDALSAAGGVLFEGIKDWGVFLNGFTVNQTLNSISGNIWIYTDPMGDAAIEFAEKSSTALGVTLFVISDIISVAVNFSNPDLSVAEKFTYTGIDIGYNAVVFALGLVTFPYGLMLSVGASIAIEVFDLRGISKDFFKEWWEL